MQLSQVSSKRTLLCSDDPQVSIRVMASDLSPDGADQVAIQNGAARTAEPAAVAAQVSQVPQGATSTPDSTHSCTISHGSNKPFDPMRQGSQEPGVASAAHGDKRCSPSDGAASVAESETGRSALPLPYSF